MKIFSFNVLLAMLVLFVSCRNSQEYEQPLKSLDSLSGALNLKITELRKTDTALLQRCLERYTYYRAFAERNIRDTISKEEADNLNQFVSGGEALKTFSLNRKLVLQRASLLASQQNKLSLDMKNKSVEAVDAKKYLAEEAKEASRLLEMIAGEQQNFTRAIENFKNSLRGVESLIRSRNKGQLPTVVKDTLSL